MDMTWLQILSQYLDQFLGVRSIVKQVSTESDRKELIDFPTDKNLTLQQNNVNLNIIPDEYSEAMDNYGRAVEGEFREVDSDVGNETK